MIKKDIDIEFLERLRKQHKYSCRYVSHVLGKDYETYYRSRMLKIVKFNTQDLICLIDLYKLNQNEIMKLLGLEV